MNLEIQKNVMMYLIFVLMDVLIVIGLELINKTIKIGDV